MSLSPNASKVSRTIELHYARSRRANSLTWIFVNGALFLLFTYDLLQKCAGYTSALHWVELALAGVLGANVLQHARRLARGRAVPAPGPGRAAPAPAAAAAPGSLSPPRAWRGLDASPPPSPPSPAPSPRMERLAAADQFIADQQSLSDYLRAAAAAERAGELEAWPRAPAALPHYQLASLDSESSASEESAGVGGARAAGAWRRLLLEPRRVTEWNLNLRVWLTVTVLRRLARELEHEPPPPALRPYLEPFADRRYAAQRIRELTAGGCLSAYRWNGGGAAWDESKPTDAELLLHVLSAYLDAQLPGAPGARPFSSAHVSAAPAPPPRGPRALALHRAAARPPHYVLVLADEIVEVAAGRNNLLHSLLLFLAAAARSEPPTLQRVHLGPAGLNMLWIIGR